MGVSPSMTIFGIEETKANTNRFTPHYKILANKLYPSSNLVLLNPRSVMFTRESFSTFDFWNLDSDFFFAEDALSFNEMMNYSGNHFAYFSLFLKVLRIAHGYYDDDFLDSDWTKNKAHMLDIFSNLMISDVVMVSPVLRGILEQKLPTVFGDAMTKKIQDKFLVLPPPDLYKFEPKELKPKSFKTLTFLWNHRFMASKNPKLFFGTIAKLVETHPKIPVKVMVLSSLTEKEVLSNIPEVLHPLVEIRPYAYDDAAYSQALMDSNITLGSSMVESYGIAILEAAKHGSAVFNFECNAAYSQIMGDRTTFKPKEMVDKLVRFYDDQQYRRKLLAYQKAGLAKIEGGRDYRKLLRASLNDRLQERLASTSAKSPKLAAVMKALEKRVLTKPQVYEIMGWKSTGTPINTFWGDYYYGLRKLGALATKVNGTLYFHLEGAQLPSSGSKPTPGKVTSLFRSSNESL